MSGPVRIGTAGWALPAPVRKHFPAEGSHLRRYAGALNACELNSTFYRLPRADTAARWADSVPAGFMFSTKLSRSVTHEKKLRDCETELAAFFAACEPLGERLACVLVQLPPSLAFDPEVAGDFLADLALHWPGSVALEPRHASWFSRGVDAWLAERSVARVLADPVLHPGGERPGGTDKFVYLRLHGSPRTYYSPYEDALLESLAARIALAREAGQQVWCMFDNTAGQAAAGNALALRRLLAQT
jgi:uncharacterized protein YecE (DUF72 family)